MIISVGYCVKSKNGIIFRKYVDTNSLNSDQKEVLKALDISQNTLKKYLNLFNKSF